MIYYSTANYWNVDYIMLDESRVYFEKKYETELGIDPEESINIVTQTRNYHVYILKWILYIFENTLTLVWPGQLRSLFMTYWSKLFSSRINELWRHN